VAGAGGVTVPAVFFFIACNFQKIFSSLSLAIGWAMKEKEKEYKVDLDLETCSNQ
jgi:hypothetical protein